MYKLYLPLSLIDYFALIMVQFPNKCLISLLEGRVSPGLVQLLRLDKINGFPFGLPSGRSFGMDA